MRTPAFVFTRPLLALTAFAALAFSLQVSADPLRPPAAPQVTIGAELKYVRFDWLPASGATYYQLRMKVGNGAFTPFGGQLPASVTKTRRYVGVHLEDWAHTRYQLLACNSAGCTGSAPMDPLPLMLDTIGYFKASNTEAGDLFGRDAVISDDGLTLAVSAEHESSGASGVNGDQADNSSTGSGAVYIFRGNGSVWRQEAYLKPPVNRDGARLGAAITTLNGRTMALSRDGSLAVIGAPAIDSQNFAESGEVYVYQRGSTGWRHTATIQSPDPKTSDFFGVSIDLSLDGMTLKVSSNLPSDGNGHAEGRTHIYRRSGSTWQREVTLAPYYTGDFCRTSRLSGDGATLVVNCYSLSDSFHAVTYKHIAGTWVHISDLTLARYMDQRALALNYDGTALALGMLQGSTPAVGLYRWSGAAWVSEDVIPKPAVLGTGGAFGFSLVFDRPGNQLAIGDYTSTAAGAGVSGTVSQGGVQHGAVFVYRRSSAATLPWRLRSVVKAPNPGPDFFGSTVSLSGSGKTLAVGAQWEASKARGVHGDQTDESAPDAGAAYLY